MKLGSAGQAKVATFPSGAMTLDMALGGGLPRGRIVEIYGPESSGKTTLAMHAMAEMQKLGGTVALIDAEHAFDPDYAQRLGLNVDDLVVCQPETGEMALEVVDTLVRSAAVDLICVDSVAALVPRSEIEGEIGMVQVGAHARLMSQAQVAAGSGWSGLAASVALRCRLPGFRTQLPLSSARRCCRSVW
jgi:recombination protein RecA